jgi:hypothetical protein
MSPAEVIARAHCMRRLDKPICEKLCEDCLWWADHDLARLDAAGLAVVPKEPTRQMIDALNGYAQCAGYIEEGYRAMVAAAKEGKTND